MKHTHRLIARGYPGVVTPKPYSYLLSSGAFFKQASKAGLVSGLRRLTDNPKDLDSTAPLILDFTPAFDPSLSAVAAWSASAPGAYVTPTEALPSAFKGGVGISAGLGWTVTDPGVTGTLSSSQTLAKNRAHSIRFYIEKPAVKTDSGSLAAGALWQYRFDSWQFQARDGKFEIMRRLPAWSQASEDSLHQLEKVANPSAAQSEQIAALRAQIYTDYQDNISLGDVYNRVNCLTFIAEPGPGNLHIFSHTGEYVRVEHSEIRDQRLTPTEGVGTMWNACKRSHRSRGHLWFAQWGTPAFRTKATLKTATQKTYNFTNNLGDVRKFGVWDLSATGSNVSLDVEVINTVEFRLKMEITGDGTGTPFIYSAVAVLDPGERSGSDEVFWDSDDHRRASGRTIIKSVQPQYDGVRRVYRVEVWDQEGTSFPGALGGINLHCLEGRLVDLYTNGMPDVVHGLIIEATPSPMASVEDGIIRSEAMLANSLLTLTIADGHALLDDAEVEADAIGDAVDGNEWLRFWLKCAGFRASELTHIPTTFDANLGYGNSLPPIEAAAWGESPRERPAKGTKIGAYLGDFIPDYGMGALLLWSAEGWRFQALPTTVTTRNGNAVDFRGKKDGRGNPDTYPGRFAVLAPLEAPRDWTDCFNEFPVEGAELPDGSRVSAMYTIQESQNPNLWNSPHVRNHMGRAKRAPIYRRESLRTVDQCWRAARGRSILNGAAPGRYYCFETYYHWFLRPLDVIQVYGRLCRIERIPMADSYRDRMQIAAREMY